MKEIKAECIGVLILVFFVGVSIGVYLCSFDKMSKPTNHQHHYAWTLNVTFSDSTNQTVTLHFDNTPYEAEPTLFMKIDTMPQCISVMYDKDKVKELLCDVLKFEFQSLEKRKDFE